MPAHSGTEVDYLQLVGWLLLWRILHVHLHYRLMWSVFFFCLCAAFCVVADEIAHSSHLKCASEIESESAVCYVGLFCEN